MNPSAPLDLRGTRSSAAWAARPGSWDALNMRAVFHGHPDDDLDIPILGSQDGNPTTLINYNARNRLTTPEKGDCVHFFLDDYRFETMWTQPARSVARVMRVGMSLTPDFSLYPEMPQIAQMWNIYRSRWCGAWMAAHGVQVIPTVGWSDSRSYGYAFRGLAPGGTVAVATVGIIRATMIEQKRYIEGYEAMVHIVKPARVVVYGKPLPGLPDSVEQVYYDPRRWS